MAKLIAIIVCFVIISCWKVEAEKECVEIHLFLEKTTKLMKSLPFHTYPVFNLCTNQIAQWQYKNATLFYRNMTHSEPCTKYLENNRMTVYQNIYMQLVSLWDSANCDSCASAVNETAQFMNLSATLDKCFANTTNPCAACDTDYQNVQQFYAGMEKKRHGSGMCFDIEDRMNQTRRVWSGQYNCCKDKRRSMVVFASIASVVCVLPFVFYTLMHVVTIRRDSHRISLLSATSVNDESGQPSSSGANNIVQRNSEMERIVEADDNEEDHENSDNDYDGDSIPKKVAFLAPISNLNNLDVKEGNLLDISATEQAAQPEPFALKYDHQPGSC